MSTTLVSIMFVFSEAKRRKVDGISSPSSQVCHVIATFVILVLYFIRWYFGKYVFLKLVPFELELTQSCGGSVSLILIALLSGLLQNFAVLSQPMTWLRSFSRSLSKLYMT